MATGKNQSWDIKEEDLQISEDDKPLGRGSYGVVYRARWKGMPVAAKKLHDIFFADDIYPKRQIATFVEKFKEEWELLATLKHPNILTMFGVVIPSRPGRSPILVTELLDCSLLQFYKSSNVSEESVVSIMRDVAQGLRYLHQRRNPIAHRDLASKNIVLTPNRKAKIADLGIARVFQDYMQQYATPGPGTPVYQAPETQVLNTDNQAAYSPSVDIFSFGVVLLEVSLGEEPRPPLPLKGKRIFHFSGGHPPPTLPRASPPSSLVASSPHVQEKQKPFALPGHLRSKRFSGWRGTPLFVCATRIFAARKGHVWRHNSINRVSLPHNNTLNPASIYIWAEKGVFF